MDDEANATEYKKSSKSLSYTPLGPPNPPRLRATGVGLQAVNVEWLVQPYPKPDFLLGYRLIVNSELKQIFEKKIGEFIFADMLPGKVYELQILTLVNPIVGQSLPSNPLILICPERPAQPLISQVATTRPNSVTVGWKPPKAKSHNRYDQILYFK